MEGMKTKRKEEKQEMYSKKKEMRAKGEKSEKRVNTYVLHTYC